ncbi:hypothetical protein [Ramlibacter montanisoli]|uniref:hypothetical protein n=1 Tax=Ramlibacter montanisoli TaxID=2732512 RepID=UPI0028167EAD|nr:hypothetical protein [Ramlibacter montanisoli]
MSAAQFQPIAPRPAPRSHAGTIDWLRRQLFGDWRTGLATVLLGGLLLWVVPQALDWTLFSAVWRPDLAACRAAQGEGACWG